MSIQVPGVERPHRHGRERGNWVHERGRVRRRDGGVNWVVSERRYEVGNVLGLKKPAMAVELMSALLT